MTFQSTGRHTVALAADLTKCRKFQGVGVWGRKHVSTFGSGYSLFHLVRDTPHA